MNRVARIISLLLLPLLLGCSVGSTSKPSAAKPTQSNDTVTETTHAVTGRLLYVQDNQIWLHHGTDAEPLPIKGEGASRDPSWSPDQRFIAYIHREESFADLYLYDVASKRTIQITHNASALQPRTQDYVHQLIWAAKPIWEPDGKALIYLSQTRPPTGEGEQPAIYEFPLSMFRYDLHLVGTREPINDDLLSVQQGGSDVLSPAWSPDGNYVAYVDAPRDDNPRQLMLYSFASGESQQYPGVPQGAYDPAWSPDGNSLAFAVNTDGATDIWVVPAPGGGTPQRITKLGRARLPVWSPTGTELAFLNVGDEGTDAYVVSVTQTNNRWEAGEPLPVTTGANIDATAGMNWGK